MRKLILLLCLVALWGGLMATAEERPQMPQATSVEDVQAILIASESGEWQDVARGKVRYVAQTQRDVYYCEDYWQSGEEKGLFDLTAEKNRYGIPYDFYIGTMCTRAVYSMALSYLGVDMTPVQMSELLQERNLNEPYDAVTALFPRLTRIGLQDATLDEMMANYLQNEDYSPLYVYMKRTNGTGHALLLTGYCAETKRFIAVDPQQRGIRGESVRVYEISFNMHRELVQKCAYNEKLEGAMVLQVYQWHLVPEETEENMEGVSPQE